MKVKVNIEKLVLHGIAPHQRHQIGEAVRSELARLVAEQGIPAAAGRGMNVDRLDGGTLDVDSTAQGRTVGRQVARAAYRGMGQRHE